MKIEVVIGSNYGDEGKGQTTYGICSKYKSPIVVLTNGGCQRGHTVEARGFRHVFHHFGSGTFLNAPSYYPATYFMNPMEFCREYGELSNLGFVPTPYRSEKCLMQFPSDVLVNRMLERSRRKNNLEHGSCGWGIWETVLRNKYWPVTVEEFSKLDRNSKRDLYLEIFNKQASNRIGNFDINAGEASVFKSDGFISHFIDDFEFMYEKTRLLPMDDLFFSGIYDCAVFENAQGLLLDSRYSHDEIHSTPSMTGMEGVVDAIDKSVPSGFKLSEHVSEIFATYVSRTYLTRHGAGPFREEDATMSVNDRTNLKNDWQGSIRIGRFDDRSCVDFVERTVFDFNSVSFENIKKRMSYMFTYSDLYSIPDKLKDLITARNIKINHNM